MTTNCVGMMGNVTISDQPRNVAAEAIELVILDLDETFWSGTLAEGGITSIPANIELIKELAARGIVSSVCSKNDMAAAREVLEELGVWEYLISPCIEFAPKGVLIRDLIEALQLRAQSVLFVDDNSMDLGEAQHYAPGIQVATPDVLPGLLADTRCKGQPDPQLERLNHYKVLQLKQQEPESAPDNAGAQSIVKTSISEELLCSKTWQFYHKDGPVASLEFSFLSDGRIGGYSHQNEASWRLDDGVLELLSDSGEVKTRFSSVKMQGDGVLLEGQHLPDPSITLCLSTGLPLTRSRLPGTKAALADHIKQYNWKIGDHTYGVPMFIELGRANLTIGKYTSIAGGVKISFGDHRMDTVSTYPFYEQRQFWPSVPLDFPDHVSKGDVHIGNDVWIGADVTISSGVSIGDGAVIGNKALVTRDVPPYAIVGGVPARIIRFRFSASVIQRLLKLKWWDWPDDVVDERLPHIMTANIEEFLERFEATTF